MNDFDHHMESLQKQWRDNNVATREHGSQNGKQYPWIRERYDI
jgi:hypothetical protein